MSRQGETGFTMFKLGDMDFYVWADGELAVDAPEGALLPTTREDAIEITKALLGAHGVELTEEVLVDYHGILEWAPADDIFYDGKPARDRNPAARRLVSDPIEEAGDVD